VASGAIEREEVAPIFFLSQHLNLVCEKIGVDAHYANPPIGIKKGEVNEIY